MIKWFTNDVGENSEGKVFEILNDEGVLIAENVRECDAPAIAAVPEFLEVCQLAANVLAPEVTLSEDTKARLQAKLLGVIEAAKGGAR